MHLYLKVLILFCGGDRIRQHNQKLVVYWGTPGIICRLVTHPPPSAEPITITLPTPACVLLGTTGHCLSAGTMSTLVKQEYILHHSNNFTSTIGNIKEQVPVCTFRGDFLSPKPVQSTQRELLLPSEPLGSREPPVSGATMIRNLLPPGPLLFFSDSKARY